MSIISCLKKNLPGDIEDALTKVVGKEKALAFAGALMAKVTSQDWSVWNIPKDISQMKSDLEDAAKEAGLDWGTIAEIVIAVATKAVTQCVL